MIKIGSKIKLLNANIIGKVIKIHNNYIYIKDHHNLEYKIKKDNVLEDIPINYNKYILDLINKNNTYTEDKNLYKIYIKKRYLKLKNTLIKEVDLHIEKKWIHKIKNILEYQIHIANQEIKKCILNKNINLILIHGKGSGILRNQIINLLKTYENNIIFKVDLKEYNFNAIQVKYNNYSA